MIKIAIIGLLTTLFVVLIIMLYNRMRENFDTCYPGYAKTDAYTSFNSPFKGWCDEEATVLEQERKYGYGSLPFTIEDEFSGEDNICTGGIRVPAKKSYNSNTKGWCKRNDYGY